MKLFVKKCFALTFIILIFQACSPEAQVRTFEDTTVDGSTTNNDSSDFVDPTTNVLTGGISQNNFFQQGSNKTTTTLSLFSDFNDSFVMRGDPIHNYLKEIVPTQNNLCMVFQFSQTTTLGKPLLALGARIRFFTNTELGGREYFLQMDANTESINVADCLTVNLSSAILSKYGTNDVAYKLEDVCSDCSLNKTSIGLDLFNSNGLNLTQVSLGNLALGIIPSIGSSGPTDQNGLCQTDGACKQEGFNCCVNGQCVNHGEIKNGVNTASTEYLNALQQILTRPELIKNYQQFFYVCNEFIPEDPDNTGDDPDLDPIQQADELFSELTDLYNCLNPIIDEFSICTVSKNIDIDAIGSGGTNIVANADDLTFKKLNSNLTYRNIVNVEYAGDILYQAKLFSTDTEITEDPSISFVGLPNDDLFSSSSVLIDKAIPIDAPNELAKIRFRVDGTCERIGTNLARCKKSYVQGQNSVPARSSDHTGGNQIFKLPPYANLGFNVIVEVGGLRIAPGTDTWQTEVLSGVNTAVSTDKQVRFTDLVIANGQTVDIIYYVSQNVSQLMLSRDIAQSSLNEHCNCDEELGCNLDPVTTTVNGVNKITSYECLYPQPDVPPMPLQETFYVSAKSVPHRYFDVNGVHYDFNEIGNGESQEGEVFEYTSNNLLKPNNINNDIGFNEIYGSMKREESSPMPAYVMEVEKGKNYDLFVDEGAFSTCLNCGVDPYSGIQKLFPNNFLHKGGGYLPDLVESRRRENQGQFTSDEMRFGRACFVPATMIPWTHTTGSTVQTQRLSRLDAQHFLFANGYNRDWYGFDYGSLIASYDGVKWFSVGNQRRVQAKGNKIFFAINAYFGDLTINNTFKVTISETSAVLNSGSAVVNDIDSDGAQCQRSHFCESDNDCITQLGYDYTCQNISSLKTPWPLFDANGNEIVGSTNLFISSIIGGTAGQVNRCVYRGKGSICEENLNTVTSTTSYAKSSEVAFHACSPNSYCEDVDESTFNTRISRYGDTAASQNNKSYIINDSNQGETDTYGLGARTIGRPFKYYGNESTPSGVLSTFNTNNVKAICIPGKAPELAATIAELNSVSAGTREADKMYGIGRTMSSTTLQDSAYYAACPATDEDGDFTYNQSTKLSELTTDNTSDKSGSFAIAQNLSSNLMNITIFDELQLFNDESSITTKLGYQKNTCLRSAGSTCYSDLDCAPNRFITNKVKTLTDFGTLNSAEQSFWQEELTCGYSAKRYPDTSIYPDPFYDITEHKCCMEKGNEFTYKTQAHEGSDFDSVINSGGSLVPAIPGVNIDINSDRRYSKNSNIYDKIMSDPDKYFPLYGAAKQPNSPLSIDTTTSQGRAQLRQYNTLHLNNSRMCCSGHWVRSFASGTNGNGGGHVFGAGKQQNLPPDTFKALSWFEDGEVGDDDGDLPFTCNLDNYTTANCEVKNIVEDSQEEQKFLNFFGKFELIGIPQVLIETSDEVFVSVGDEDDNYTSGSPYTINDQELVQSGGSTVKLPIRNTVRQVGSDWDGDGENDAVVDVQVDGVDYFSAASYDNFQMEFNQLKKVFSEDEFNCCLPTGFEISDLSITEDKCCSGSMNANEDGDANICCLDDFTDLSVYTNRYVSSEGANFNGLDITDEDIDPETGYIKTEVVLQMAPTMCCSGMATTGVAINNYFIPIDYTFPTADQSTTRRWLYDSTLDNASETGGGITKYNAGVKFNNHVYCVGEDFVDGSGGSSGGGSSSGGGGAVGN